ncbi:MAG: hypothetical protein AAB686_03355 [Patescibacteria group bacterium]
MASQKRLLSQGGKKRNGYGWRQGTDANIKAAGKFAERLIQHVLGGVHSEELDRDCDVWYQKLDVGIESKLGSNKDGVKVREGQLDAHIQTCKTGFPFSDYWYGFLKYRNTGRDEDGMVHRLFQETVRSEADVPDFLGEHITGLYVLDISVVDAVRNGQEGRVWLWMGPRRNECVPAVRLGWRFFAQLQAAPQEALHALGLDSRRYRFDVRSVQTVFDGQRMEFEFLAVLGRDLVKKGVAKRLFQIDRESVVAVQCLG